MSDIAGPPAPKEIQSQIRGADKTAHVAKDPNNTNTPTGDQPREQTARDQGEAQHSRDPAVSIASTAAHLVSGQEIANTVSRIDPEGRPIIVTDTVTLALKPDAGLKPNDTVQLRVVDAGKQVTADLIQQNEVTIDPPVRLSVTVIEIHVSGKPQDSAPPQQPSPKLDAPYQSPVTAQKSLPVDPTKAAEQTANLTTLISSKTSLAAGTPENNPMPVKPQSSSGNDTGAVRLGPTIASSADLATLIQQQSATSNEKAAGGQQPIEPPRPVNTANPNAVSGPGIGPALSGVSIGGAPVIIQLLDTAISKVIPAEVAEVKNVQPVTAAEARTLPLGASAVSTGASDNSLTSGELMKLDTSRGEFILRASDASALAGELVRVSIGAKPSQANNNATAQANNEKFRGLLIENNPGAIPTKVEVSFVGQSANTPEATGNLATITSVQTAGAFFGADGPKTDLRLQTSRGDISVTVPSGMRPIVGDQLSISPPSSPELSPLRATGPTSNANASAGMPAENGDTSALATARPNQPATIGSAPNILSSWPAMEESLAALLGTNAAAAASLAAKTAQGGSTLTNSLLFFLKAAGMSGNANWIGEEVEKALSRSSQRALGNLRSDLNQMANIAGETIGEWRPILIPLDARGGDVPLAALLLGQRQDINPDDQGDNFESSPQDKDQAQRFILQVQFSVLGDIQLDGQISKQVFDLTVRSKIDLPQGLQKDAADLFYASLAANEFAGSIDFLEQNEFSVDAATLINDHLQQRNSE